MITTVEPSGVIFRDICEIQTKRCVAKDAPAGITAVWSGRRQINVCSSCMAEMVRRGEWKVKGSRIKPRADVAIFDDQGKIQLVAEVKFSKDSSPQRAVEIRQNKLAHSAIPHTPFLLIAFPDCFYLWKEDQPNSYDRQADYSFDAKNTVSFYAQKNNLYTQEINPQNLQVLVSHWLKDLVKAESPEDSLEWATKSGLYDAIKDCSVATDVTFKSTTQIVTQSVSGFPSAQVFPTVPVNPENAEDSTKDSTKQAIQAFPTAPIKPENAEDSTKQTMLTEAKNSYS